MEAGAGAQQAVREVSEQIGTYVAWVVAEQQRVADYVTAVVAEQEHEAEIAREAAEAAAQARPSSRSTAGASGGCASGGGQLNGAPMAIIQRESGGDYCARNASGACGAYQIMPGTWNGYGGYASACDAPPAVQDEKARSMAACNWQPPNYCAGS